MVVLGADTYKRNYMVVAADKTGAEVGSITGGATPDGHLRLVKWAARWPARQWAIEDCRQLSRRENSPTSSTGTSSTTPTTSTRGRLT